jgi:hypothetical protein
MIIKNLNTIKNLNKIFAGLDPDAKAFIDATGIVDNNQITTLNTLVINLKTANLWSKMIAIYPYIGGTAFTHKFNLKDPQDLDSSYRLTFFGGWTHSATGALPNGTNAYANTFLGTDTIGLNSGHMSFYSRTDFLTGGTPNDMGVLRDFAGADSYSALTGNVLNVAAIRYNNGGFVGTPVADTLGYFCGTRTASNVLKLFKNGSVLYSPNTPSGSTTTFPIFVGAVNNVGTGTVNNPVGYSPREQAFASIGTGLTDADVISLSSIVENYNVSLSRNV